MKSSKYTSDDLQSSADRSIVVAYKKWLVFAARRFSVREDGKLICCPVQVAYTTHNLTLAEKYFALYATGG